LSPTIKKLYPDRFNYAVELDNVKSQEIMSKEKFPTYKEKIAVMVGIAMNNKEITEQNKAYESQRVFKLLQFLKEKKVPVHHVSISFKNKNINLSAEMLPLINNPRDVEKYIADYN
jgi:hypothetical protein